MSKLLNGYRKVTYTIKRILLNKRLPEYYAKKSIQAQAQGKETKRVEYLKKGLSFYPNNIQLNSLFAVYLFELKKWTCTNEHFQKVFKNKNNKFKTEENYLFFIEVLLILDKESEAEYYIDEALRKYKNSDNFIMNIITSYERVKKYEKAIYYFIDLIDIPVKKESAQTYLHLGNLFFKNKQLEHAIYVATEGVKHYPQNEKLYDLLRELSIKQKLWDNALRYNQYIIENIEITSQKEFELNVEQGMLLQICGKNIEAKSLYENLSFEAKTNEVSYHKIILFDNGDSRIEFYKNLNNPTGARQVVLSFDSLFMTWNQPAFGFKNLMEQNVDIIALRKRESATFHQDLSQEEYIKTVENIIGFYEDRVAYGHSLGAYTSLYYTATLNCRILSMAPRVSIHPVFGSERLKNSGLFKHNIHLPINHDLKPTIVYDPKSARDKKYIKEEVLSAYPNAQLIEIKYAGHGITRHLLQMNQLKSFLKSFLDFKTPIYDSTNKHLSSNYYRLLGTKCLKRNKFKWADNFSEKALELQPNDKYCIQFRVEVLSEIGAIDKAIELIEKHVNRLPKSLFYRKMLIDLCIANRNILRAEIEIGKLFKITDKEINIEKWQKEINEIVSPNTK